MDDTRVNEERYSPYHPLDVRIDLNWRGFCACLDLLNAYDLKNIYLYYWVDDAEKTERVYQWRLLPVAGIAYEF